MKKILNIPLFSQPKGTLECGSACAKMILDYDHQNVPYETIQQKLPIREKFGLYIYEIGSFFLSMGYQAEIAGFNTHFMHADDIGASTESLKENILSTRERRNTQPRWQYLVPGYDTLTEFIDNGGTLSARILQAEDIKSEITKDRPVLAALTTQFLYPKSVVGHNEHFSVITGFSNRSFNVNDPGTNPNGNKQKFPINHVMYAIHANTAPSVEGGMILKLTPP